MRTDAGAPVSGASAFDFRLNHSSTVTMLSSMEAGLELGISHFNARRFYDCHEVLEDVWLEESPPRKQFLQAIIHFAVAFYHDGRDNRLGALRQLRKGIAKLAPYLPTYEDVDTSRLFDEGLRCLASLEQDEHPEQIPIIHLTPDLEDAG
jgi:predicted metal-dependent hydrolase